MAFLCSQQRAQTRVQVPENHDEIVPRWETLTQLINSF